MTFGEYLNQLIKEKGYNLKEFAKLMNSSETTIRNYIDNSFVPTVAKIGKIANLLEVDYDMLFALAEAQRIKNKD